MSFNDPLADLQIFDVFPENIVSIQNIEYKMKTLPNTTTHTKTLFFISDQGRAYVHVDGKLVEQTYFYSKIIEAYEAFKNAPGTKKKLKRRSPIIVDGNEELSGA